ncbi:MAG: hypothetical protein KBF89_05365 [Acidimicrobiia bacterium]|nr:hypothetical protein [Acidimicrobiia bacterium]
MAFKIKRRVTPLDENQKRQRQIAIIAIFLSVALFFIGFQIGKNNTNENTTLAKQDKSSKSVEFGGKIDKSQITNTGPKNFSLVVPTGFSKSEDGAIKAGATYVESWPQLLFSTDFDTAAAINFVTTSESTELRKSLAATITSARESLSGAIANQAFHQSVPLKIKVNSADSTNVSLTIWSLELWASAGELEPQSTFDFQDMKLVYVDNDWKISSWITSPGPTPEWKYRDQPLDSINFIGAISQFKEYKR